MAMDVGSCDAGTRTKVFGNSEKRFRKWDSAKRRIFCVLPVLLFALAACTLAAAQSRKIPALNNQLSPATAVAGSPAFYLTVYGTNFTGRCVVLWNGVQRPTTVMNGNQATATIYAADIALAGTATIQVLNTNTGAVSNSVTFTTTATSSLTSVSSAIAIAIAPTSVSLQAGATAQFTASVTGTTNTAVTWTTTGGGISSSGLYVAPSTAGTYMVTAISVANPNQAASATVTVAAPPPQFQSLSASAPQRQMY